MNTKRNRNESKITPTRPVNTSQTRPTQRTSCPFVLCRNLPARNTSSAMAVAISDPLPGALLRPGSEPPPGPPNVQVGGSVRRFRTCTRGSALGRQTTGLRATNGLAVAPSAAHTNAGEVVMFRNAGLSECSNPSSSSTRGCAHSAAHAAEPASKAPARESAPALVGPQRRSSMRRGCLREQRGGGPRTAVYDLRSCDGVLGHGCWGGGWCVSAAGLLNVRNGKGR